MKMNLKENNRKKVNELRKIKIDNNNQNSQNLLKYTLPSNIEKMKNISQFPNQHPSQREPMNSEPDTNLHSQPISTFKTHNQPRRQRVQSAHRIGSLKSVNYQYSKTQTFFPGTLTEKANQTLQTLERKSKQPRRGITSRSVGNKYIKHFTNSKKRRDSNSNNDLNSSGRLTDGFSVMNFENSGFKEKVITRRKNSIQGNAFEKSDQLNQKSFWQMGKSQAKEKQKGDLFNYIGKMDDKRKKLLGTLISGRTKIADKKELVKILKNELKKKKKNVLQSIRENNCLKMKWKGLNQTLVSHQETKINQYEYLKKLFIRDKTSLTVEEKSILSNINMVSKSQIQNELSKILNHETDFIKINKSEISNSKFSKNDLLLNNLPNKNSSISQKNSLPRIYSD